MFKPYLDMNDYFGDKLTEVPETLNRAFDDARLQAERGIEEMYEIVHKRGKVLGWKRSAMLKALKAAFNLIHKL